MMPYLVRIKDPDDIQILPRRARDCSVVPHDFVPFLDLRCDVTREFGGRHRGWLETDRTESFPGVRGTHCVGNDAIQFGHD
jgi:hypothetical protein